MSTTTTMTGTNRIESDLISIVTLDHSVFCAWLRSDSSCTVASTMYSLALTHVCTHTHTHTWTHRLSLPFPFRFTGKKVFSSINPQAPFSFKFTQMVLACTGGGIMVPIFINAVPVPLAQDAYPIAIMASYVLHDNFPILREIFAMSSWMKVRM